jgi:transcriptional regulator with XRE-family HTH domain
MGARALGERIAAARIERRLTQAELARAVGESLYRPYERGHNNGC